MVYTPILTESGTNDVEYWDAAFVVVSYDSKSSLVGVFTAVISDPVIGLRLSRSSISG
jgi:hypothetical protein